MWHLTCLHCCSSFTAESRRGRKPGFCSEGCRLARAREQAELRPAPPARDCAECGERPARAGGLICNRCNYAARPRVPCTMCGEPSGWLASMAKRAGTAVVCHECRRARPGYRVRDKRARGYVDRWSCAECGIACERPATKGQRPRYCETCRKVRRNPRLRLPHSARLAIYARDAWTCGLCGDDVDRSLIGTQSHWRPSLDHVVPRSSGGSDEPTNLRLAHWWCNSIRGAGVNDHIFEEAS